MASGWRQDGVRMRRDEARQASEVCQGSGVGVRSTSRCVRMRQKGVRVASGRRRDNLASGWRQDDVKRRGAQIKWTQGTTGFGVSRRERSVCVVELQVHVRASTKICHAHIPTRLVSCWNRGPLGCCGKPSPVVGSSRENINMYILSSIYAGAHSPFTSYCLSSSRCRPRYHRFNSTRT